MKTFIFSLFSIGVILANPNSQISEDFTSSSLFMENNEKIAMKLDPTRAIKSFTINPEFYSNLKISDVRFPWLTNSVSYRTRLSINEKTGTGNGHKFSLDLSLIPLSISLLEPLAMLIIPIDLTIGYQYLTYQNPKNSSSVYYGGGVMGKFLVMYSACSMFSPGINLTYGKEFNRNSYFPVFIESQINLYHVPLAEYTNASQSLEMINLKLQLGFSF